VIDGRYPQKTGKAGDWRAGSDAVGAGAGFVADTRILGPGA